MQRRKHKVGRSAEIHTKSMPTLNAQLLRIQSLHAFCVDFGTAVNFLFSSCVAMVVVNCYCDVVLSCCVFVLFTCFVLYVTCMLDANNWDSGFHPFSQYRGQLF